MRTLPALLLIAFLRPSGGHTDIKGLDPDFASFYDSGKSFQCLDGSAVLDFRLVNDDYCDCSDGSDEPGTSACANGSFYCSNLGFRPSKIPSSRVSDGICDCCDGSDEEASLCSNVCYEMDAQARAEAARLAQIREEGLKIKEDLIRQGQEMLKEKKSELARKQDELNELTGQKEKAGSIKEEKEGLERAALEVYREIEERERLLKEEEEKVKKEGELSELFKSLDANSDGIIDASELQRNIKFDQNNDGLVSSEEAAFYLSGGESYDYEGFKSTGLPLMESVLRSDGSSTASPPPLPKINEEMLEEEELEEEGEEEEGVDYEDLDDDEIRPPHLGNSSPDEGDLIKEEEESEASQSDGDTSSTKYDDETQRLIDEANKARTDYDALDRRFKDTESEIGGLKRVLENDYGNQMEYLPLSKECFELSDLEYTYKMCPFDHCTQRSKNGGSETRLGDWSHWEDLSSTGSLLPGMKFEKGTQCWNGPQRSTAVHISCGTENKLTAVSEPSKCEYVFQFETPAACLAREETSHDEL